MEGSETETPMRNPFRSEADAFRLFVIIAVAVALIALAETLGGPWVGVPVAVVVFAVAIRATWRWFRLALSEREL